MKYGFALLLMCLVPLSRLCSQAADGELNKKIIAGYLHALKTFDHEATRTYNHPSKPFAEEKMKGYRDFEKNTNTRWRFRIVRSSKDSVFVYERESNLFYDALGVGERVQLYCYILKDGLIYQTARINMHHRKGEYRPAYARFLAWMQQSGAQKDTSLIKNDDLVFDGSSAIKMKPWLRKWRKLNAK